MRFTEWLRDFSTLHERARRGHLSGEDRDVYVARRDELMRALVSAQHRLAPPEANRRKVLRVARALEVELETCASRERALTATLSAGGFSAALATPPPRDEALRCLLRMPSGEQIDTMATPVATHVHPGSTQVSFTFVELDERDRERLQTLVFDTALEQLSEER